MIFYNIFFLSFSLHIHKGDFIVNAGAPTDPSSEKVKVKVKLRVDKNGCFSVSSASMIETLPPSETPVTEEPMEISDSPAPPVVNGENKENQDAQPPAETTKTEDANMSEEKQTTDSEKVLLILDSLSNDFSLLIYLYQ